MKCLVVILLLSYLILFITLFLFLSSFQYFQEFFPKSSSSSSSPPPLPPSTSPPLPSLSTLLSSSESSALRSVFSSVRGSPPRPRVEARLLASVAQQAKLTQHQWLQQQKQQVGGESGTEGEGRAATAGAPIKPNHVPFDLIPPFAWAAVHFCRSTQAFEKKRQEYLNQQRQIQIQERKKNDEREKGGVEEKKEGE